MAKYAKPAIYASRCLGFDNCRYNGVTIRSEAVDALKPFVKFVTHCPEVEIGMGVPRKPIRIVRLKERHHLIQQETGADFVEAMETFTRTALDALPMVEGFILKARSPSCGPYDVKIYGQTEGGPVIAKGAGVFASQIIDRWGLPWVVDEGRLTNFTYRERFLIRAFTLADFRRVKASGKFAGLVDFQARNKLLFMGCNQTRMRAMGKLIANHEKLSFEQVSELYEQELIQALRHGILPSSAINVFMHALGYFKKVLNPKEKAHFLDLLEDYRNKKLPVSAPVSVLRSWIARIEEPYLSRQTFFAPYPPELVEITDSGKGRDY